MQRLLNQLEVVVTELQNHHSSRPSATNGQFQPDVFIESLNDQVTAHKNELISISMQNLSKKKAKQLVKLYQPGVIKILDSLYQSLEACNGDVKCKNCTIRKALDVIAQLLCFLREQFPFAFDAHMCIPASIIEAHTLSLKYDYKSIHRTLSKKGANKRLIKSLLHPFTDFLSSEQEFTFCNLSYLQTWAYKLNEVSSYPIQGKPLDNMLCKTALEYDLNSSQCINCLELIMTKRYKAKKETKDQLVTLNFFLKCVNQVTIVSNTKYQPSLESLQASLAKWLIEEIRFIEKKCSSYMETIQLKNEAQVPDTKLTLMFTVPMVAIFIRGLVENKYLGHTPKREIFRFFSKHFSSVQSKMISENNLKNEYYDLDPTNIEAFKEVLFEMLKWVQKL